MRSLFPLFKPVIRGLLLLLLEFRESLALNAISGFNAEGVEQSDSPPDSLPDVASGMSGERDGGVAEKDRPEIYRSIFTILHFCSGGVTGVRRTVRRGRNRGSTGDHNIIM